jgi:hypothetical protein
MPVRVPLFIAATSCARDAVLIPRYVRAVKSNGAQRDTCAADGDVSSRVDCPVDSAYRHTTDSAETGFSRTISVPCAPGSGSLVSVPGARPAPRSTEAAGGVAIRRQSPTWPKRSGSPRRRSRSVVASACVVLLKRDRRNRRQLARSERPPAARPPARHRRHAAERRPRRSRPT